MSTFLSSRTRPAAEFPKAVWDRLIPYSVAAGAALSIAAPSARAEVVYTPSDIQVTNGLSITIKGVHALNFFTNADVIFSVGVTVGRDEGVMRTSVDGQIFVDASRLSSGASIGPNRGFPRGKPLIAFRASDSLTHVSGGAWASGGNGLPVTGYLGFRFLFHGAWHYGWARITDTNFSVTVNGYAYETEPGRAIAAGDETGLLSGSASGPTLGLLAHGSRALLAWRK